MRQNNPGQKMEHSLETSIFKELNILPFDKICILEDLRNILVFKALNNLAPNILGGATHHVSTVTDNTYKWGK